MNNRDFPDPLFISNNKIMQERIRLIETYAKAPSVKVVLLLGEPGTGKEYFARHFKELSPRRNDPFVTINMSAIPDTMFESELYGHARGAFTGAIGIRKGHVEAASEGIIFMDEVEALNQASQAKLLRLIEYGDYFQVGSDEPKTTRAQFVVAMNKNPENLLHDGKLRRDFHDRIKRHVIKLLPLKDRREDIPLLAEHLLNWYAAKNGKTKLTKISECLLDILVQYDWPGNVRELAGVIEDAVIFSGDEAVILDKIRIPTEDVEPFTSPVLGKDALPVNGTALSLREEEKHRRITRIRSTLAKNEGNVSKSALELGMPRSTLNSMIKRNKIA
ncbi:MAG TPA: sigma 54-interacting transcriptional regulator [Candidatus Acidoferrales bacterium]|nr:sigma 54-interacting transcriptional regulator [Candidatus Acidoferrales bacterium]